MAFTSNSLNNVTNTFTSNLGAVVPYVFPQPTDIVVSSGNHWVTAPAASSQAGFLNFYNGLNSAASCVISFNKNRDDENNPTLPGDNLGQIQFNAYGAPSYAIAAQINGIVDPNGLVSTSVADGMLQFLTYSISSSSLNTCVTIDRLGQVVIATPQSGGVGLTINGGGLNTTGTTTLASLTAGAAVTSSTGVVSVANGTAGYVLTSTGSSTAPTFQAAPSVGFTWAVTTINATLAPNNGYIANKAGLLTMTLPTTSSVGDTYVITGMNRPLGWTIAQNASQYINFGVDTTTVGTGGSLSSTQTYDTISLVCIIANTAWNVTYSIGNITVV
jgi:hypothetical protein